MICWQGQSDCVDASSVLLTEQSGQSLTKNIQIMKRSQSKFLSTSFNFSKVIYSN
jgi:hypothetical protein